MLILRHFISNFGPPSKRLHNPYCYADELNIWTIFRAILFMLNNPEPFKKAQIELDQVVGPSRLPNCDDRPNLPYFEALMAELMRRANVAPFALFHSNEEEGYISGFR